MPVPAAHARMHLATRSVSTCAAAAERTCMSCCGLILHGACARQPALVPVLPCPVPATHSPLLSACRCRIWHSLYVTCAVRAYPEGRVVLHRICAMRHCRPRRQCGRTRAEHVTLNLNGHITTHDGACTCAETQSRWTQSSRPSTTARWWTSTAASRGAARARRRRSTWRARSSRGPRSCR